MSFNTREFVRVFTSWGPETDTVKIAVDACRNGYGIVPVKPAGKTPLCTLSARELKAAGERHACGVHHAITDPKEARRVFTRLAKTGELNIGIVAHPSRMVVVDADTPEAVDSFLYRWAQGEEDEGYLTHSPTVRTPGTSDQRHHDGGHYYFWLPEGIGLPVSPGQLSLPGGADVRWGMVMTVAPPSRRPEGRYLSLGEPREIPAFLLHAIRERIEQRTHQGANLAERYTNDSVVRWSVETPWAELLLRHGWTDTHKLDRCDCPVWEKPGGGTSGPKSATAHQAECDVMPNVEGHGALHLWTTDPPGPLLDWCQSHGTQTVTKFQFVTAMEYGGDEAAAKHALGLELPISESVIAWLEGSVSESPDTSDEPTENPSSAPVPESQLPRSGDQRDLGPVAGFWMPHEDVTERQAITEEAGKQYRRQRGKEYIEYRLNIEAGTESFTVTTLGDVQAQSNVPDIGKRQDGVLMLYRRKVNVVFGRSDNGKSWVSLAFALDVLRTGGRVVVIDVEDDYDGFSARMAELGVERGAVQYVRLWGPLSTAERSTLVTLTRGADLVIVDSFDGLLASQGIDSNNASGVRSAGALLKQLARGGAAVLLVDHSSEKSPPGSDPRDQMGSSAKKAFIDGTQMFAHALTSWKRGKECRTMLEIGKDRHGWAKEHALFETEGSRWGRLCMVRMQPAWPARDGSEIALLVPPSYDDQPSYAPAELTSIEDRVIDFLRSKPGEWQGRTGVLTAAGDKNGRGLQQPAIDHLVELGVIERQEAELRGGRVGIEYRYVALDSDSKEGQ